MKGKIFSDLKINPLFIIIVSIAALPLIFLIISFILIGNEDDSYKKELNNPIINADYQGWHIVELCNEETIMLPDGWSISTTESITVITDENGEDLAKGGKLTYGVNSQYLYDELITELLEYEVTEVKLEPIQSVRSSEYGTMMIAEDNTTEYSYIMLSNASTHDMLFIVDPTVEETDSNLADVLEAIIFSYVWK